MEDAINTRSYREAGVDIDAGAALVEAIKPMAASTARSGTQAGLGGFGALFDLKAAGFRDPILVSTTDGVGTKLKIAIALDRHDTVGIDLVAMCVNDLVVQGAEPLFFLDYFATGRLSVEAGRAIVAGIAEGCRQAGCALVGGETAEMPGMYAGGDYDLAGFAVGAVERDAVIDGSRRGRRRCRSSAWPRPGSIPTASRWCAGSSRPTGWIMPPLPPSTPRRASASALLTPDADLCPQLPCRRARRPRQGAWPISPAAGSIENIPRVLPEGLGAELDAARLAAAAGLPLARSDPAGCPMPSWRAPSIAASA